MANLVNPAGVIIDGDITTPDMSHVTYTPAPVSAVAKKSKKRRAHVTPTNGGSDSNNDVINFRHDSARHGMPKQEWNTAQKALWLLYILQDSGIASELPAGPISRTFKKHFRQFGNVTAPNVSRDLGKLKAKNPSPVGEDTTKSPSVWYLTEEGCRQAQSGQGTFPPMPSRIPEYRDRPCV